MKILILLLSSCLTACSAMNPEFNCHLKNEGVCAPLSEVNRMVDEGYFQ